eukprot:scaffold8311_cov71-Phaeocystis_antarctica.AAC.4
MGVSRVSGRVLDQGCCVLSCGREQPCHAHLLVRVQPDAPWSIGRVTGPKPLVLTRAEEFGNASLSAST